MLCLSQVKMDHRSIESMDTIKRTHMGPSESTGLQKTDLVRTPGRRKLLEWLGLGAMGAMVFSMLPFKRAVSKRILKREDRISISINKDAVKRVK